MTKEELEILNQISVIGKRIKRLPALIGDTDRYITKTVQHHINSLQIIVMSREGMREYKKSITTDTLNNIQQADSDKIFKNILKKVSKPGISSGSKFVGGVHSPQIRRKWTKKDTAELKELQKHGKPTTVTTKKKKVKKVSAEMSRKEINQFKSALLKKNAFKNGPRKPFSKPAS